VSIGGDGSHGAERVTGGEGFLDEGKESPGGVAGDHVEGDQVVPGADEILVVGIEDPEVVTGAVIGAVGDFGEAEGGEPVIDFRRADGNDLEARLGSDDGKIAIDLVDNAFQPVEAGDEEVLEVEAFEVFEGGGFPKVEAPGIHGRGNQREFNAGAEAEDAVAGDLEDAFAAFQDFMFLPTAIQKRDDFLRI
jgi:hypothetical protein